MVFFWKKLKRNGLPYREKDKEIIIGCDCASVCALIKISIYNWNKSDVQSIFLDVYQKRKHKSHTLVLTPEQTKEIADFIYENIRIFCPNCGTELIVDDLFSGKKICPNCDLINKSQIELNNIIEDNKALISNSHDIEVWNHGYQRGYKKAKELILEKLGLYGKIESRIEDDMIFFEEKAWIKAEKHEETIDLHLKKYLEELQEIKEELELLRREGMKTPRLDSLENYIVKLIHKRN